VHSTSRWGQDGPRGPRSSSFRGSGTQALERHRSRSTYTRHQNRNPQPNQRFRRPEQSYSRRHRSQDRPDRRQRHDSYDDRRTGERSARSRDNLGPTSHQNGPQNQDQNRQFRSLNPDFCHLVRSANNGVRLLNHMGNWERIPGPIERAVDELTSSIRPPLIDEDFNAKIQNIGDQFKANVHRTVNQHLIRKYTETCRTLDILDDTDMGMAHQIARRQLVHSNHRINNNRADTLLNCVIVDTRDHLFSQRCQQPGNPAAGQQTAPLQTRWQHPRNPVAGQQTSPAQGAAPVQTSNKFQPLADLGEDDATDQIETEALMELLDNTMEDPETQLAATSVKRPVSRRSPTPVHPQIKPGCL